MSSEISQTEKTNTTGSHSSQESKNKAKHQGHRHSEQAGVVRGRGQEWVKWVRIAEKEEERYQAECEALSRVADEPVRKPKPQPRTVSEADVRAAFERGILSWRLL